MKTAKQLFEDCNIAVFCISKQDSGFVKISAKNKIYKQGQQNYFSVWCTALSASKLAEEHYNKKINQFKWSLLEEAKKLFHGLFSL